MGPPVEVAKGVSAEIRPCRSLVGCRGRIVHVVCVSAPDEPDTMSKCLSFSQSFNYSRLKPVGAARCSAFFLTVRNLMTNLIKPETMQFTDDFLNLYIAPNLSRFSQAEIPDLKSEFAGNWIASSLMNRFLKGKFSGDFGRWALAYIRRTHHAFAAYHDARQATSDYLASSLKPQPSWLTYYRALEFWENFTLQSQMAISLLVQMNENQKVFDDNERPRGPSARLYHIGNSVKHLESLGDRHPNVEDTVPLWLTNDGLKTLKYELSYLEAAHELRGLAQLADKLQNPMKFVDDLRKANGEQTGTNA